MLDGADVAALLLLKYIAGVAAEELAGDVQEKSLGCRKNTLDRNPSIVDAVFAADQVGGDQWTVNPRQHVIVQSVHLAECRAHLADPGDESCRKSGEGNVTLFEIHALFTKGDEKVAARIGIDNRLQSNF